MQQTAFYNQVTISTEDVYSRKSVKLFPNGSIQVAGCSHPIDCERVLKQVAFVIEHVTGTPVEFEPPSIQMINTNFSLNFSVNLRKVIDVFSRNPTFKVAFNPERYSAVKLKFEPGKGMKQVTASIFSTGRIIVTGARTLTEIAEAYRILNESIGCETLVKRTEELELFDNIMGAPFKAWDAVLRRKILCNCKKCLSVMAWPMADASPSFRPTAFITTRSCPKIRLRFRTITKYRSLLQAKGPDAFNLPLKNPACRTGQVVVLVENE
jgi:TATA-box binding protein (TBP) (component of TFIID and TFIIIB)